MNLLFANQREVNEGSVRRGGEIKSAKNTHSTGKSGYKTVTQVCRWIAVS
jgi:hypothetical protein